MCSLTCTNIQILEEHVDLHLEEDNFSEGTWKDAGLVILESISKYLHVVV